MSSPRVTIVTPVYNGAAYLSATIASIGAQSFEDFEHIVVDDCSTDDTPRIAQAAAAADARVRYLRTPSNFGGPAGPRNLGIASSSSPYVAFCDADDLWAVDKLERQMALAGRAPILCTALQGFVDGGPPPDPAPRPGPSPTTAITLRAMLAKNRIALSSALVPREVLERVGPFETARDHVAVEDYDMWLRILQATGAEALRIDLPLLHYRRVVGSLSANKLKGLRKAVRMQTKAFERDGRPLIGRARKPVAMARYMALAAWNRYVRGDL